MIKVENKGLGHGYENAYKYFMGMPEKLRQDAVLVHGIVLLTHGDKVGIRDGHAWIEWTDKVFDPSQKQKQQIATPKEKYYEIARVKDKESKKYNYMEALENFLFHKHYGPWDGGLPVDSKTG